MIPLDWRRGYLCVYGDYGAGRLRWLEQHAVRDLEQRTRIEAALAAVRDDGRPRAGRASRK